MTAPIKLFAIPLFLSVVLYIYIIHMCVSKHPYMFIIFFAILAIYIFILLNHNRICDG